MWKFYTKGLWDPNKKCQDFTTLNPQKIGDNYF